MASKLKRKTSPKKPMRKKATVSSDKQVSIQKISNGWLTRTSWTDASGNFKDSSVFSKTEPKLTVKAN